MEVLSTRYRNDDRIQSDLDMIRRQISRISAAVELIRDMQGTIKSLQSSMRICDFEDIIRASIETVTLDTEPKLCDINLYILTKEYLKVDANPERLTQAFVNIIRNAVEAYEGVEDERPREVSVTVALKRDRGELVVSIKDNGKGIPSHTMRKLARPMFSTKLGLSSVGIRGMGIFSAFRTVQMHGGSMAYESDGMSYTAVRIAIPVAALKPSDRPAQTDEKSKTPESAPILASPSAWGLRVLLLDDDVDWSSSTKEYLEGAGKIDVDVVRSTREASTLLRNNQYDAVLVDMRLRSANGVEYGDRWLLDNLHLTMSPCLSAFLSITASGWPVMIALRAD